MSHLRPWCLLVGLLALAGACRQDRAPPAADAGTPGAEGGREQEVPPGKPPPLTVCPELPPSALPLPAAEVEARRRYACSTLTLEGHLVAEGGGALAGARVRLHGVEATSGADGAFRLTGLPRTNGLLEVSAEGFRPLVLPVQLRRSLAETSVLLPPQALARRDAQGVRLLFAGDLALGRRFLDPTATTPRNALPADHPEALIQVSDPVPGSRAVTQWVRPLFQAADMGVVNLETPVTDRPATPHTTKDFAFFTLPGSLAALTSLNVGYVSLGNNHVYDYLEAGLADTLRHVREAGLGASGAGPNAEEAFRPWHTTLAGTPYAFLSMCSISGEGHAVDYVASDTKGGAADLRDDARVKGTLAAERAAGRVPIALVHAGVEYSTRPGDYALERMHQVAEQGAALVIAHHPHTVQGFGRHAGVLLAHSLGNFAFDQDRLETMLGLLAEVDLRGEQVASARALPIYLEDYRPRPATGALADVLLRRVAEASREAGVDVVPDVARAHVLAEGVRPRTTERQLVLDVTVGPAGWAAVDLRPHLAQGESLAGARLEGGGGRLVAGSDLLLHGDFEDHDVDEEAGEVARWALTERSSFPCLDAPHRGAQALCQVRSAGDVGESVVAFRNRVRVPGDVTNTPNTWLTLLGWMRAENAGRVRLVVPFYASEGEATFGQQVALAHEGGTFAWTPFATDVSLPREAPGATSWDAARALRLFLHHAPPARGEGLFSVDDLAVVAWEEGTAAGQLALATPHPRDFVRVEAAPGPHRLRLTLRSHQLP